MKHVVYLASLLVLLSCNSTGNVQNETAQNMVPEKQLPELKWLIGRWENNSDQGNLSEVWEQSNDSTFFGGSYFVIQGDTVFSESIRLEERKGKINYCVTVSGQNDGEEVCFELTKRNNKNLTFENPKHDYPSKITYQQKGDSLIAEISGKEKGEMKSERFSMKMAR